MTGRRQAPFWPVAIIGGIIVIAVAIGIALIVEAALGGSRTSSTFVAPVVISVVLWIGGMIYAHDRRRRTR